MKIILDANFLIYAAKQKIDYISEIEILSKRGLVVPSSVVEELKKLKQKAGKTRDREAASLALQILNKSVKNMKIRVFEVQGDADEAIVKMVNKKDAVATMDKELKKRLKGKARILTIRKKKKIEIL